MQSAQMQHSSGLEAKATNIDCYDNKYNSTWHRASRTGRAPLGNDKIAQNITKLNFMDLDPHQQWGGVQ
jgi:hypothetical protein